MARGRGSQRALALVLLALIGLSFGGAIPTTALALSGDPHPALHADSGPSGSAPGEPGRRVTAADLGSVLLDRSTVDDPGLPPRLWPLSLTLDDACRPGFSRGLLRPPIEPRP